MNNLQSFELLFPYRHIFLLLLSRFFFFCLFSSLIFGQGVVWVMLFELLKHVGLSNLGSFQTSGFFFVFFCFLIFFSTILILLSSWDSSDRNLRMLLSQVPEALCSFFNFSFSIRLSSFSLTLEFLFCLLLFLWFLNFSSKISFLFLIPFISLLRLCFSV